MSDYIINGKNLTLCGNPETCAYSVVVGGAVWNMSERPYVIFSDDTVVPFPAPDEEGVFKTGVTEGISSVYTSFGEHKITVKTKAELEVLTDDIYFTLEVTGDEKCEIKKISFPAPFDFGEAFGDKGELSDTNLPLCYTVL